MASLAAILPALEKEERVMRESPSSPNFQSVFFPLSESMLQERASCLSSM
jgi:hypothetical protein